MPQPSEFSANAPATAPACLCTYCGLPTTGPSDDDQSAATSVYCCYGCRFAHAVAQESGTEGVIRWTVIRLGLAIFFTMNVMAFTMTMWSLDVYDVEADPFQQTLFAVFRWLSMLFALPVLILLGVPLLQNAFDNFRRRVSSTDILIVVAVTAAYVTSMVNVFRGFGTTYFEVGTMVLVMMTLGRWIEAAGRQKATESLDQLLKLLPEHACRITDQNNTEETIPASVVAIGDLLHIRAGDRFPTDGLLQTGATTVDEQVFTGESLPVRKSKGDSVLGGTVNLDGDVLVESTSAFREGSFGRLLQVLQEAKATKGYYQRLADRASRYFAPAVAILACVAFLYHTANGVGSATQAALSVLLIACPCALGLATPLAVWTALSTAVKHGVLFRNGESIERLATAKTVCFDKTGTLTTGTPHVFQKAAFTNAPAESYSLAKHLAESSRHPFSQAVATYLTDTDSASSPTHGNDTLRSVRTVAGGGVEGVTADGRCVRLGSVEFCCCDQQQASTGTESHAPELCVNCRAAVPIESRVRLDRLRMAADERAASIVLLSIDSVPVVGFLVSESIRAEAESVLRNLSQQISSIHVLSGDRRSKGEFLLRELPIPGMEVHCRLSPTQKAQRVSELRRNGTVVMVGDGINDAPALATSDVGIAMGCGADVSRDSAHVCLLSNDLSHIPWAISLAQRTRRIIIQNLTWTFGYNALGVAIAASGRLNPAIAAALMIGSSLLVIGNSLKLLNHEAPITRVAPGAPLPVSTARPPLPPRAPHSESTQISEVSL